MAITHLLKELGLNDTEAKAYVALVKHGRIKPAELARLTKLNRATTYSVAKSLQSKGLLAEDGTGSVMYLNPLPPTALKQLIERPKRELEQKQKVADEAVAELTRLAGEKDYPVPKLRFVPEHEIEEYLYDSTQRWQQSAIDTDGVWWGYQDHSFVEAYERWIHSTWKTSQSKNPKFSSKVVSNESNIERALAQKYSKAKRDVRALAGMNFTSTLWVAGDYVVMIQTSAHPFYLFEIHDALLAANLREVCKKLWAETKN
jgi:sugar-specific transcriptional regulator TrmB